MRVAFLAPHFSEYSLRLSAALTSGAAVLLAVDAKSLSRDCMTSWVEEAKAKGLSISQFHAHNRLNKIVSIPIIIVRTIVFRPDVIHTHEYAEPFFALALTILGWFFPIVMTVHDPVPHSGADEAYALRRTPFLRWGRRIASAFVVHGIYCSRLLSDTNCVGDRPILEIVHGPCLVPNNLQRRDPDAQRILFFGRMEAYKGLDVFLDALRIMAADGLEFEARLCGRGPEMVRLKPQFLAVGHVCIRDFFLTPEQAIDEFQKAAVVAAPYRDATQSGVVACAFANGRPVVASKAGGLPDMVKDGVNGILVDPNDPSALAEVLSKIISDPGLLARLCAGAAQSAETIMSWDTTATRCLALYETL